MLLVTVCKSLTAQRITRNSCIHLDVAIGLLSCKVSQRWEGTLTSLNLLHRRMKLQPCMAYPRCHGEMFLGKLWHQVMWYKANVLEIAWRRKSCFVGPGQQKWRWELLQYCTKKSACISCSFHCPTIDSTKKLFCKWDRPQTANSTPHPCPSARRMYAGVLWSQLRHSLFHQTKMQLLLPCLKP